MLPDARRTPIITFGNLGLFALMSVIWGGTWIAIKAGVTAVPPVFFAGVRYGFAAAILMATVRGWAAPFRGGFARRTVFTGVLVNGGTYSLLFWGMQFIDSGIAGLINLALIPVGLFGLSIVLGDERPTWRHGLALLLGAAGLSLVLVGDATLTGTPTELLAAFAIVAATFCYCLGTVLSRPLMAVFEPVQVATAQAVVGAVALLAVSVTIEPLSGGSFRALTTPAPMISLLFLSIFGTIVAYSIYLRLVRDWGPSKAGLYPFISPIIALALGWLVFAEQIGWPQVVGAITMLAAAALAMTRSTPSLRIRETDLRDHPSKGSTLPHL